MSNGGWASLSSLNFSPYYIRANMLDVASSKYFVLKNKLKHVRKINPQKLSFL